MNNNLKILKVKMNSNPKMILFKNNNKLFNKYYHNNLKIVLIKQIIK